MSAHRVNWIGRDGIPGRWCHAPGCHTFAANIRAQQIHADVHEARPLDTATLIEDET